MTDPPKTAIIGAGISGLTLAHGLRDHGFDPVVFETSKPGGRIRSGRTDGYLHESGPIAYSVGEPGVSRLIARAGLQDQLIPAAEVVMRRWMVQGGKLVKLPLGPPSALFSPLLSFRAKWRAFREHNVPPGDAVGESLAAWFTRRFGPELRPIAGVIARGVYAGDPERLEARFAFRRLVEMEQESGSVIRHMMKHRTKQKLVLASFRDGAATLPNALARDLDLQGAVTRIEHDGDGFTVVTAAGEQTFERVVCTTGIGGYQELAGAGLGELTGTQRHSPMILIDIALPASDRDPAGYGYLCPPGEDRFLMGAQIPSSLYPHRAPPGRILFHCFAAGIDRPQHLQMTDADLVEKALVDLQELFSLSAEPVYTRVTRLERAIPQLEIGHQDLLDQTRTLERRHPGLYIRGIGVTSVGVGHLIDEMEHLVGELTAAS